MTTIWQQESPTQTDKGNLLVNAGDVLADNNGDTIVFNNGIFYDSNTEWEEDNTF